MIGAWDPTLGTIGGAAFGEAVRAIADERKIGGERLAQTLELDERAIDDILDGRRRLGLAALARIAQLMRLRPIELLQRCGVLSLETYAAGLDPLYFLPEGPVRYQARIYMREINPRHRVPEGDMTKRNATIAAITADPLLDALGKLEMELAYLLRTAAEYLASDERGGSPQT